MLLVGLTGGVGSGKTAAANLFRDLGACVSQSDEVARVMMRPGHAVFDAIVADFGPGVLTPRGELDRHILARLAFADGGLERLNSIVHPPVLAEQAHWIERIADQDPYAVAVVESALIFETVHVPADGSGDAHWRKRFNRIIVVTADLSTRAARYAVRIGAAITDEATLVDFHRRCAAQWSDEQRVALADFRIRNDGTLVQLQEQVANVYGTLQQESAERVNEAM